MKRFRFVMPLLLSGMILLCTGVAFAAEVSLSVQDGVLSIRAQETVETRSLPERTSELSLRQEDGVLMICDESGQALYEMLAPTSYLLGMGLDKVTISESIGKSAILVPQDASLRWLTHEAEGTLTFEGTVELLHVNAPAIVLLSGQVEQLYVTHPNAVIVCTGTVAEAYVAEGVSLQGMEPTDTYNDNMIKTINLILKNGQYVEGHR